VKFEDDFCLTFNAHNNDGLSAHLRRRKDKALIATLRFQRDGTAREPAWPVRR